MVERRVRLARAATEIGLVTAGAGMAGFLAYPNGEVSRELSTLLLNAGILTGFIGTILYLAREPKSEVQPRRSIR